MSSLRAVRYELALVAVALIWGINFPVVKSALATIGPLTFNALRFSLAGLLLGGLYWHESVRSGWRRLPFPWVYVVGLGLLGHFAYQMMFIFGIDNTTAGNSAFLISSAPLWTALVARLRGYERLNQRQLIGLGVAFLGAGTLVIGRSGLDLDSSRTLGNLLSLGGGIAWGSFTALSRPALRGHSPLGLAFWTMITALPLLWLASFLEPPSTAWTGEPAVWIAIVYSGLFSIGVAYVIWNVGIKRVGPSHTAVYANMVPVVALIMGVFWLGESVTLVEISGAALILVGLFLVRR